MTATPREIAEQTRRQQFGDSRFHLVSIEIEQQPDAVRVRGSVLDRAAADGFMRALRVNAPGVNWRDELTPLVTGPDYSWALVVRPVADIRREPRMLAERVSQALIGDPVEVLRYQGAWAFVRLHDGYLGWMMTNMDVPALQPCAMEAAQSYAEQHTHLVKHPFAPCFAHPSGDPHEQNALLPFGVRVTVDGQDGMMRRVRWPDDTTRWVSVVDLLALDELPQHSLDGLRTVVAWLQRMVGVPYLWGGKTPFGYDCSGLMQVAFGMLGVQLRRDADQQSQHGELVPFDRIAFGDLLFFDTRSSDAAIMSGQIDPHVSHVGLALNSTDFLNSSFSGGGVMYRSFDPHSPFYSPTYDRRFLGARRYIHGEA